MSEQNQEDNNQENIENCENKKYYEIKEKMDDLLGKGAFSSVYLGKADVYKLKDKQKEYIEKDLLIALKELPNDLDKETVQSISNEIDISLKLDDNSNIVKMIGLKDFKNKNYIAYEYCNGGDLRKYIDYFQYFDESLVQIIMMQIVNGLVELFKKNVVHHDIKPENILLKLCYDKKDSEDTIQIIKNILDSEKNNINNNNINQNNNQIPNNLPYQNNFNNNMININNNMNNLYGAPMMNMNNNFNNMINMNNNIIHNNNQIMDTNLINMNNNMYNINNNINYNIINNMNNNINNNINCNMNNNINNNMNCNMNNNINNNMNCNMNNNMNCNMNNNMNCNMNSNMLNMNNCPTQVNPNNYFLQNDYKNSALNYNNNNIVMNQNNESQKSNMEMPNNNLNKRALNTSIKKNKITPNKKPDNFNEKTFLNILKDSTEYKLSDFGLSKLKKNISKRNLCGSPLYMSPELFKIDSTLSEIESKKVDIWALGILAYELFFGKRPFEAFSIEELSTMFQKGTYIINLRHKNVEDKKKVISKEFFLFLNKCLQKDPEKRLNVFEVRDLNFLRIDISSSEKMTEEDLGNYLKGIAEIDSEGNLFLNINRDYEEEIKQRDEKEEANNK